MGICGTKSVMMAAKTENSSPSASFIGTDLARDNLDHNYWKESIQDCIDDHDGVIGLDAIKEKLFGDKSLDTNKRMWEVYENSVDFMYNELEKQQKMEIAPSRDPPLHLDIAKDNIPMRKLLHHQSSVKNISADLDKDLEMKESIATQETEDEFIKGLKAEVRKKLKSVLGTKNPADLDNECASDECCNNGKEEEKESGNLLRECESFKRLEIVLDAYNQLIIMDKTKWKHVQMTELIRIEGQYEHQQLFNDFCHVKAHIDRANVRIRCRDHDDADDQKQYKNMGNIVYTYFAEKDQDTVGLPCGNINECIVFSRNYQDRTKPEAYTSHLSIQDIVFQAECDKIHCYFFHSTIKFGIRSFQTNTEQEEEIDNINRETKSTRFSKAYDIESSDDAKTEEKTEDTDHDTKDATHIKYIGRKQDNKWWEGVRTDQEPDQVYQILVENIGIFRWQNAHGFKESQYQGIMHNGKKFNNVKEEALKNDYTKLSIDSWNQTLRKAQIFHKSWIGRSIKTKYESFYDDKVAGHHAEWSQGTAITLQEIVTLKLYTDFDKLQSELKKCFRYESVADILEEKEDENKQQQAKREDLENRLANFYYWRGGLLIVLNKFGTKLNQINNLALYHGVNAKMLIRTSQRYAFYGPLSTSSSFHVARTFATAKGMVLKITSHFPRLNYCNALDCSSLSDYPEEQEWLIGFMYVRVLQVRTRKLTDRPWDCAHLMKTVPMSSFMRQLFFTVHLFNEQIFSMSEHLERWLKQFLKVNRMECCDGEIVEQYKEHALCPKHQRQCDSEECKKYMDWDSTTSSIYVCAKGAKHLQGSENCPYNADWDKQERADMDRKHKIFPVLWGKFRQFAENPNLRQRIKFDVISDCLKRFFMKKDEGTGQWRISFLNITTVYPNIKEIHFVNEHIFDDVVLQRLIDQIKRKTKQCKRNSDDDVNATYSNTIEKIVFLYYNYKDEEHGKPLNSNFKDPDTLNKEKTKELKSLGWEITGRATARAGYKIRIYQENKK